MKYLFVVLLLVACHKQGLYHHISGTYHYRMESGKFHLEGRGIDSSFCDFKEALHYLDSLHMVNIQNWLE